MNGNFSYYLAYLQYITTFGYIKFYTLCRAFYLYGHYTTPCQRDYFQCLALCTIDDNPLAINANANIILHALFYGGHLRISRLHG